MKKLVLAFLLFTFHKSLAFCQSRSVTVSETTSLLYLPVTKKKGKEAKQREVTVKIYQLQVKVGTSSPRELIVSKYMEFYKDKLIKESYLTTGEINKPRHTIDLRGSIEIEDVYSSYESSTDLNEVCCQYKSYLTYQFDKRIITSGQMLNSVLEIESDDLNTDQYITVNLTQPKKVGHYTIGPSNSIYDPLWKSETELINRLKKDKFSAEAMTQLLSVNKYMNEKYAEHNKYEQMAADLNEENKLLREQLRNSIYNVAANDPSIKVKSYKTHTGIVFTKMDEIYGWKSRDGGPLNIEQNHIACITYPEGSKYEGKVELRLNDSSSIMQVVKSSTKTKVPYEKLMFQNDNGGIKVFGYDGSLNNVKSVNQINQSQGYVIPHYQPIGKEAYEVEVWIKDYLTAVIPERKAWSERVELEELEAAKRRFAERIEKYEQDRSSSLSNNGFFLETMYLNDMDERPITYAFKQIYRGEFDQCRYDYTSFGTWVLPYILETYINMKSSKCYGNTEGQYLVQTSNYECARYEIVTNGLGVEVRRTCVEYRQVQNGKFTTMPLNAAREITTANYKSVYGISDAIRTEALSDYRQSQENKSLMGRIYMDLDKLFRLNGCSSQAMKRFEENLSRIVQRQSPLTLIK